MLFEVLSHALNFDLGWFVPFIMNNLIWVFVLACMGHFIYGKSPLAGANVRTMIQKVISKERLPQRTVGVMILIMNLMEVSTNLHLLVMTLSLAVKGWIRT